VDPRNRSASGNVGLAGTVTGAMNQATSGTLAGTNLGGSSSAAATGSGSGNASATASRRHASANVSGSGQSSQSAGVNASIQH
jgi:hypothetical protein